MTKKNTRLLLAGMAAALVACGPSGNGDEVPGGDEAPGYESPETGVAAAPTDGEESAEQLTKGQSYDHERTGSRLVLAYVEQTRSFVGTVENVSAEPLSRVRVEVHLSNGVELGPTTPVDLAPGASHAVSLEAPEAPFETWSAHAEVGGAEGEHEHEGEEGEHEGRESGEHEGDDESGKGKEAREHTSGSTHAEVS